MTRKRTLHLTARHTETECILTEILSENPSHSANDYHQRRPVEPILPKISRIIKPRSTKIVGEVKHDN